MPTAKRCILALLTITLFLGLWSHTETSAAIDNKSITFAFMEWKPVFYLDDNRKPQGIYPEILSALFEEKLGYQVQYQLYPWKRCQLYLQTGKVDVTIMLPTEERLQYSYKSEDSIYSFYLNVFTYKNHPKLNQIKTIKTAEDIIRLGLRPATNLGNGWHKKNIDDYGVKTRYVSRDVELFKFLSKKRADIVIDVLVPSLFVLNEQGLRDSIEVTSARFGPTDMHLMMSKLSEHVDLMPEINKAFRELKEEGIIDQIIQKYEKTN